MFRGEKKNEKALKEINQKGNNDGIMVHVLSLFFCNVGYTTFKIKNSNKKKRNRE